MSDDREDLREDVRALLKVMVLMLPVWKRQIGTGPLGSDQTDALRAIEEAERELADRSPQP